VIDLARFARVDDGEEALMGLDMSVYATSDILAGEVDFPEIHNMEELHSWRKHPNLHGWMYRLYRERGGSNSNFNGNTVRLNIDDLNELEVTIREGRLPETSGSYFGKSDGSEREDDLEFVRKARAAIGAGKTLFYEASW
jgi:hypothetical protein